MTALVIIALGLALYAVCRKLAEEQERADNESIREMRGGLRL